MSAGLNKFEKFKRTLYLWILPIILLALISELVFWNQDPFNLVVLPILIGWFLITWLFLYVNVYLRFVEIANLILISILHLSKSYEVIHVKMALNNAITTGDASLWTPLLYVYIFITLRNAKGATYSIILWSLTLIMVIMNWSNIPYAGHASLVQYQFAILVYIIFLFFARHIIRAFTESELLEKIAYQDTLTGIGNRTMVYKWLDQYLMNKEPVDHGFSVIFFDLDHFKRINDRYGHITGDAILKDVTLLVLKNLSKNDNFGRWGGEEFIIICQQRTKEEAVALAELLRLTIEGHLFDEVGQATSSFGVESVIQGDTAESLINRVDGALYKAKQEGRNMVKSV
ncbi:GGDEF domain-containing protein [Virgibacillus sp. DJP39]|uniref:GGDEF domain-containing protein n=1 Tax=Virgibacillus sp. DJP39 TaxID=3409790 RepID=UPI003BB626C9